MATTDTFPLAPDYGMTLPYAGNVLRSQMKGGQTYTRESAPPQRLFRLQFHNRPFADRDTLEAFYRAVLTDFFTYTDPLTSRVFSVEFASDMQIEVAGNQSVNMSVDLVEAAGVALASYAHAPLVAKNVALFQVVGVTQVITYAGYGFTITATGVTDMKIDGVSVGASSPVYNLPLGLHRLEVIGSSAPTVTAFHFIA